ncbi:MAG: ferredoxin [Alphaproteobacteria bacterium]
MTRYEEIAGAFRPFGLVLRGGFHVEAQDRVPPLGEGTAAKTLILVGNAGPAMWEVFAASPEAGDSGGNPLDRWSRRVVSGVAGECGAKPFFPFGEPTHPFIGWAMRAEPVAPSPIGPLIHPDYGLWHAYRGALAFAERLELPPRDARPRPCDTCQAKPCLDTCPVEAFASGLYDIPRCVEHLEKAAGRDCVEGGCLARRACPVGAAYAPAQAGFHMAAFLSTMRKRGLGRAAG